MVRGRLVELDEDVDIDLDVGRYGDRIIKNKIGSNEGYLDIIADGTNVTGGYSEELCLVQYTEETTTMKRIG
jgi:hypothetical protein